MQTQEFHNGYIITVSEFLNKVPGIGEFKYNIVNSSGEVRTVYGLKNVEEALTNAKELIDKIGPCPIYVKRVEELMRKGA